jgi:hypothetical protein
LGGTFHAGDVINITVGGVLTSYTVVSGDSFVTWAAYSVANALNANASFSSLYYAEAEGVNVIIVTKTAGVATSLTASVTGGGATMTATAAAATFTTYGHTAIRGNAPIQHAEIKDNHISGFVTHISWPAPNFDDIGYFFVEHRGNGSPELVVRASVGSQWIDRTKLTFDSWWKKRNGTSNAGWRIERHDSAAPTTGTWNQGDRVWNTAPTAGGTLGWVCTTGGTGAGAVWKAVTGIAA